jgi:hypothetical protein
MKTSSGLLLGVLFTLVVVIVAVVIYFNTRPEEEKTETPTGPSPTLPSIGDLTIAQTLSPDSDSETYTIEPYTIEYAAGDNEEKLSKNVTFTLNWENKGGFETVSKIRVEHYIREKGTSTVLQTVEVNDNQKLDEYWDYAPISVKISGLPDNDNNQYSFVGQSMFKVIATYDGNKELPLYDGTEALGEGENHPPELVIKPEDLTATIDMTGEKTVTFSVSLIADTRTTYMDIANKSYTFTATSLINDVDGKPYNISTLEGIELIAQDTTGTEFKFKYGKLHPVIDDRGKYVSAELNTIDKKWVLFTVDEEADASKITFMNSSLDKSGDNPPGDTYRMLRISKPKCITSDNGCSGVAGKPTDTEAIDTQFLYLYGDHKPQNQGKSWLGLTGRTREETSMKHWKIEETIIN